MIFVSIIDSLYWSSGWWWWPHIRDRRFRDVFRRLNSWIHTHIEPYNLGRWKIPWQRKTTWRDPTPFYLWTWLLPWFMVHQLRKTMYSIPLFHKKKLPDFLHQGLPGLAWREEKKCKSTPYNGQYSNICKSLRYRGQYLLQHHHYEILVLVVISVLKILLFTVNTSLITNLSKWCIIHCFNSDFVFL